MPTIGIKGAFMAAAVFLVFLALLPASAETVDAALQRLENAHSLNEWKAANDALQQLGPENEPELRKYVNDKAHDGRKRAIALEAALKGKAAAEVRKEWVSALNQDRDHDFRLSCIMKMGKTKDPLFRPIYKKIMEKENEDPGVRVMAAQVLAIFGDTSGKALALRTVVEPKGFQDFGAQTLVIMKATDTVAALHECAITATEYVKKNSCRQAELRIMIAVSPDRKLEYLTEGLRDAKYFSVQRWAANLIAQIKTKEALTVMCDAVKTNISQAWDGLRAGVSYGSWTKEDALACRK
jgi:HEAT repeat protein